MNTRWFTSELQRDPEKKKAFEQAILNSGVLTKRFQEILDDIEEDLYKYEGDLANYTEGWAARQAFVNGKRKAIREIRALFNFG